MSDFSKVLVGALLLALLGAGLWLLLGHRALLDAQRESESTRLVLKNQIVAAEETKQQLQSSISSLLDQNESLRKAVEEAQAASPGAKPVFAADLVTKPVVVPRSVRPSEKPLAGPPASAAHAAKTDASEGLPADDLAPQCVLKELDQVSLQVQGVALRTLQGNTVVAGVARAWRESPAPRALLAEGRFQSALSETQALAPPAAPGWGGALLALCGTQGCAVGPGVAFPARTLLGGSFTAELGAFAGPSQAGLWGSGALRF